GMLNSIGVNLFLMIFPITMLIINWDIVSTLDYMAIISNPESFDPSQLIPSTQALLLTAIVAVISLYVGVRLQFATYIVADSDVHFMTAIKQSWNYSKGNFFRILFFPLAFFFWMLLVLITCGIAIIYVAPLMSIGSAILYNLILKEHGEDPFPSDPIQEDKHVEEIIDLDPLSEEENEEEEKDIFDNYYK
ncbi:MAG: glycerophosphoryl diester phosphodiesterase membrane domain-containing protein, partial [Bacilli bacterium]|nr:glycerophosphoryl diester phosphodiesterase membrane domain-containing protein [Bacilli bacterium]